MPPSVRASRWATVAVFCAQYSRTESASDSCSSVSCMEGILSADHVVWPVQIWWARKSGSRFSLKAVMPSRASSVSPNSLRVE
ncbi:hypothetical protein ACFFX0_21120 [Citricoccus parietis]|uniref:Secreted protein n=1 Tax=Citricoccus parietis TaxID=592307 RepID=A0ABV5G3Q6_9MICC